MFFPQLKPSGIVGQSLQLMATYLGCAMVAIDGAVFSGPLFRDGDRVYILHAEQRPDAKTVDLRCVDIGDRATSQVIDHVAHIAFLSERVKDDARKIEELTRLNVAHANRVERMEFERAEIVDNYEQALSAKDDERGQILEQYKNLVSEKDELLKDREEIRKLLQSALSDLNRYAELVGPLPPPVVAEPGPTLDFGGEDETPDRSILLEGSVTDYAFRRLMFLTGGKVSF